MDTNATPAPTLRRNRVVLLYFYVAALIGLGFVITGTTIGLFGAKNVVLPQIGLPNYAAESYLPHDEHGPVVVTDAQKQAAREQAIADRRTGGVDDLINGAILVGIGLPTLVWHLRRGRGLGPEPGEHPSASAT